MPRMTQAELNAYHARHGGCPDLKNPKGCELESELHAQIFAECRRRGWIVFHGAMSERTHRTKGEPDFVILTDGVRSSVGDSTTTGHYAGPSRVLFIECKSRTGKLSPEQSAMWHHAKKLGHTIHVVRSFEEFLKVITQ